MRADDMIFQLFEAFSHFSFHEVSRAVFAFVFVLLFFSVSFLSCFNFVLLFA